MLATRQSGTGTPTLVLMHFLGGSAREWDEVVEALDPHVNTLAVDLPGFGSSADHPGYSVSQMADALAEVIAAHKLKNYVLVGHSMSGKVAAVLAHRIAQDAPQTDKLRGLAALILVAPSPVAPEPMTDDKRAAMLAALAEPRDGDLERARSYITKSETRDIPESVLVRAADEVLRMNRHAWVAWVEHGSREDWTDRVTTLTLPTLIVVGDKDATLGAEIQQRLTLPHFSHSTLCIVKDCSHLVPMEKPAKLATLILEFLSTLNQGSVPREYLDFIHSDRVTPRTRELLLERLAPRDPAPKALSPEQMKTLHAVVDRVIPQTGDPIDIAAFIDERLASGGSDGWRYDLLPADRDAYAASLDTLDDMASALHEQTFADLVPAEQDEILHQIAAKGPIDAPHLCRWFEDLRADAVKAWMAHPRTLARIGYSGIGIGGAHTPNAGFVSIGPDAVEVWEPEPQS